MSGKPTFNLLRTSIHYWLWQIYFYELPLLQESNFYRMFKGCQCEVWEDGVPGCGTMGPRWMDMRWIALLWQGQKKSAIATLIFPLFQKIKHLEYTLTFALPKVNVSIFFNVIGMSEQTDQFEPLCFSQLPTAWLTLLPFIFLEVWLYLSLFNLFFPLD